MDVYAGSSAAFFRGGDIDADALPGDPRRTAQAMITVGDAEHPPIRQLLGSDADTDVPAALRQRLQVFADGHDLAVSADRVTIPA